MEEGYMTCFYEVFGFYPPGYTPPTADPPQTGKYRVCYPEHWYIPTSRFEKGMDRIGNWKQIRYSPYKRISHFREHLNRLQYCQEVTIPSKVDQGVGLLLGRGLGEESYFKIKRYLKQVGFSQYNEHIHYLISKHTRVYIDIDYHDRILMCNLFTQMEHVFTRKYAKTDRGLRKNIFSYYLIVQLMLYLFHTHPHYTLPTLLDPHKRQDYYVFLLNLLAETPLYMQIMTLHFTRKKRCQVCRQGLPRLDTDLVARL